MWQKYILLIFFKEKPLLLLFWRLYVFLGIHQSQAVDWSLHLDPNFNLSNDGCFREGGRVLRGGCSKTNHFGQDFLVICFFLRQMFDFLSKKGLSHWHLLCHWSVSCQSQFRFLLSFSLLISMISGCMYWPFAKHN